MASPNNPPPSSPQKESRPASVPEPIASLFRVAALPEGRRTHLLDLLGNLRPSSVQITDEQLASLSRDAGVTVKDTKAAFLLASVIKDALSDTNLPRFLEIATRLSVGKFTADLLREVLTAVHLKAGAFADHMDALNEIQSAMVTVVGSSIACDLRRLDSNGRLVPVALVRLFLDEGDPVVFQALPQHLSELKSTLEAALSELSTLSAIAERESGKE